MSYLTLHALAWPPHPATALPKRHELHAPDQPGKGASKQPVDSSFNAFV